ncbi:MAG: choice-of-anchor D domain-containing protein, partial [Acidobacteria bacterium]|nr:choice-of-anchor D domain-containing protein [Acidobacteriota bacterium]
MNPDSAKAGTSGTVTITGSNITFAPGAQAMFGAGISVGGSSAGTAGPINVTSASTATASVVIDRSAATGPRTVTVMAGGKDVTATFTVMQGDPLPVANAGAAQHVAIGDTVHLDGTKSTDPNGDVLTFKWSFTSTPSGSSAALSDSTLPNPTFTADQAGNYVLQLQVTNQHGGSSVASVNISTSDVGPVANAGPNQLVAVGANVQLDGSESTDVDGNRITYAWAFTSKPAGSSASISDPTLVNPTFVADLAGDYVLKLTVDDGKGHTSSASVTVSTKAIKPFADAGLNQSVAPGATVNLDGSSSASGDGSALTYEWSFTYLPSGSKAALSSATAAKPVFTADASGIYVLQLTVTDKNGATDTATVFVSTFNVPPVADAGSYQTQLVGTTIQLDASKSADADNDPLTYKWFLIAYPQGSTASLSSSTLVNPTFVPDLPGAYVAQVIVSDGVFQSAPATVLVIATAPAINLSPSTIDFGNVLVGSTTASTPVTVKNTGSAPLQISNAAISGANATDFAFTSASFPVTVAPGATTIINLTFSPSVKGTEMASLDITDTANGSPHSVALTGTGTVPSFSISASTVAIGDVQVSTTSAPSPLVISNTGTGPLTISYVGLSGANAAEFAVTPTTFPITVAPGASTTVNVTLTPTSTGPKSATLTIAHNAPASPQTVQLTGNGTAPSVALAPTTISFGNQVINTASSQSPLVITNNGTANLVITAIGVTGTDAAVFSASSGSLPVTVTPGNSTTVNVTFKPTTTGAKSASLTVTDNVAGSPQSVPLTGTGTAPSFSAPATAAFGNQLVGTSSAATPVVLSNNGTADLVISALAISGTGANQFSMTSGTLPITVAAGTTTTVNVTFSPTSTGNKSASLAVTDNAAGSPHAVALTGTGIAPGITFSPTTLAFGNQISGSSSNPTNLTITNSGTADLVISN